MKNLLSLMLFASIEKDSITVSYMMSEFVLVVKKTSSAFARWKKSHFIVAVIEFYRKTKINLV